MNRASHDLVPRKPWVAALMSLALPGWGQLYNGQANRGIWFFLIFSLLLGPGVGLLALMAPPVLTAPGLALGLAATLGLWVYGVADAYRTARHSLAQVSRPWQTSGLHALVFVTCTLLVLPLLTITTRAYLVQPFRIPSVSMSPALLPGDFVFADMRYNNPHGRPVRRGDVAIFIYPNDRTLYYVKRIVGLPGDRIRVEADHRVVVNGDGPASGEERIVPPGHVFVLGDNRAASTDSRQFGTVPLSDVVGRVRQIWFSHGDGAIRWDRIGKVVE